MMPLGAAAEMEGLEPIRIVLLEGERRGWVRTSGQRMTDILQSGEPFAVLDGGSDPAEWVEVFPDETLLVVPPPHVSSPDLRLPRNRTEVTIRVGDYRVLGTAHLRPGEQDDPMLRATRRFLPLTNAFVARGDQAEEPLEVVIVNLRRVDEFRTMEPG
jgi:hypothetical protein